MFNRYNEIRFLSHMTSNHQFWSDVIIILNSQVRKLSAVLIRLS